MFKRKLIDLALSMALVICLAAGISVLPGNAGANSILPKELYLIQNTEIYNDPWKPGKPVGSLSASQTVMVLGSDLGLADTEQRIVDEIKWFKIKTWLGDKWIKADIERMIGGSLNKQAQTLTTVRVVSLFDRPDRRYPTNKSITPQKLHVISAFHYSFWHYTSAIDFIMGGTGTWYQVDSLLGKKWIENPDALENVKETQVSYPIKLTGLETAYPYPFVVESSGQKIEPQVVQVIAEWKAGIGPYEVYWIKVLLPEGEKWLSPSNRVIKDYRQVNETVTLLTKTRYLIEPNLGLYNQYNFTDSTNWLKPGEYEAYEGAGDWVHIQTTDHGKIWVNPKRALLESPVGIITIDEKLALTKTDEYYRFPLTAEQSHVNGFYAPQTVKVYEKWIAPAGEVWYHFSSGNGEWVRRGR